ncbi:MAG: hypothetical protein AAGH19_01005 [Pseudomonadota bacterium]
MRGHGLTIALLLGALGCYTLGMILPAVALLLIGGALELAVWVRVLRRR